MEPDFHRPRVVVSKCLGFEHCRYNGEIVPSPFVDRLRDHADLIPFCLEVDMGLGVPRDPIRLVRTEEGLRLMQPSTGLDVTEQALLSADRFLSSSERLDGFILKSRSPSCGVKDVRLYAQGSGAVAISSSEQGFFSREVAKRFDHLAIEDEARLLNLRIGQHFLTKLFTLAEFRSVREGGNMRGLIEFQSRHKLLLMYYDQTGMRAMGRIAANEEDMDFQQVAGLYAVRLSKALSRPPRCNSANNVMMHALGYFSEDLKHEEKKEFMTQLELYSKGKIPLTVPLGILKMWVVRYGKEYLKNQSFFHPFPDEFLEMMSNDACGGRDLWGPVKAGAPRQAGR
jgi:uncharacterized protein YbgA (DUF1722 family)/uncharacterized protein YbbK (DUF523 family)